MKKILSFFVLVSSFCFTEPQEELTPLFKRKGEWLVYSCQRIEDHILEIEIMLNNCCFNIQYKNEIMGHIKSIRKHLGVNQVEYFHQGD